MAYNLPNIYDAEAALVKTEDFKIMHRQAGGGLPALYQVFLQPLNLKSG